MESGDVLASLVHVLHFMYDRDMLSETTIRRWHHQLEDEEADAIKPKVSVPRSQWDYIYPYKSTL